MFPIVLNLSVFLEGSCRFLCKQCQDYREAARKEGYEQEKVPRAGNFYYIHTLLLTEMFYLALFTKQSVLLHNKILDDSESNLYEN